MEQNLNVLHNLNVLLASFHVYLSTEFPASRPTELAEGLDEVSYLTYIVTRGWTNLVRWWFFCLTKWRSVCGSEATLSHSVQSVSSLLRPETQVKGNRGRTKQRAANLLQDVDTCWFLISKSDLNSYSLATKAYVWFIKDYIGLGIWQYAVLIAEIKIKCRLGSL